VCSLCIPPKEIFPVEEAAEPRKSALRVTRRLRNHVGGSFGRTLS
jgi:hypothetical protein